MSVPSDLFPYIYSYLVDCGLKKTVKSFKKEVNFVSLTCLLKIVMSVFASELNSSCEDLGSTQD